MGWDGIVPIADGDVMGEGMGTLICAYLLQVRDV